MSEKHSSFGDDEPASGGIPALEDNWERDHETGEIIWAPFMLMRPPLPGFPGPDRYG
jgi:hypothetical protein